MTPAQRAGGRLAAVLVAASIATPVVVKWEGWENRAYLDVGGVATACAGATRGVRMGQTYSDPQCETLLARDLVEHGMGIAPCLPDDLPAKVRGAFISTAYNIGVGAFCGSSMARYAKAGDLPRACASLDLWNKVGRKVWRGLVLRRSDERSLCESGLRS